MLINKAEKSGVGLWEETAVQKKDAARASWHMAGEPGKKPISAFPNLFSALCLTSFRTLSCFLLRMHFHGCWRICNHSQTFTFKLKIKMREPELFKESQDSYQFAHLTRESVLMWLFTHSLADNRGHDRGSWCLPQALPSFCPQEVSLQQSARYILK